MMLMNEDHRWFVKEQQIVTSVTSVEKREGLKGKSEYIGIV